MPRSGTATERKARILGLQPEVQVKDTRLLIIGSQLVILYVVGRKTGRCYTIPVAYLVRGDDLLVGTSSGWARNLRSGEPVGIRLKGRRRWADVRIYTRESEVVSAYAHMSRTNLTFARFNSIRLGEDGEPDRDDLRLAWQGGARALRLTPVK